MGSRQIGYRVALAVLVIDDFTGRILSGSDIQVKIKGSSVKPVRKPDGYFVFTSGPEIKQIVVESHFYQPAELSVDTGKLNPLHPVVIVRLTPNRLYPMAKNVTTLEGLAPAGNEIQVICDSYTQPYKLLCDYDRDSTKGLEIRLFQAEKKDLSGKTLAIKMKDQIEAEVFKVLEMADQEQGLFRLEKPLSQGYQKMGTSIFPVYTAKADQHGDYFLLLPGLDCKDIGSCQVQMAEKPALKTRIDLKMGQSNRLDLML